VSALSQGVPALSTGWSHKYSELFKDYGFEQGVVSVAIEKSALNKRIHNLVEPELNQPLKSQLELQAARFKRLSEEMWSEVLDVIDSSARIEETKSAKP
jgi:colanic acid/amylovoran biosynthesis protein